MESYKNKKALFIGNGINLLDIEQSISWKDLLLNLKNRYNIEVDSDNIFKPFPLMFEEMLYQKEGISELNNKLKNLKRYIRNLIEEQIENKIGYNAYHKKVAELPYDDILTTNYDYSLENSIVENFIINKDVYAIDKREIKHSLRRGYEVNNKKIWHIHGELFDSREHNDPKSYSEESIMIGYEHYSSYLEKIQENIRGKSGKQKAEKKSIFLRIKDENIGVYWIDTFFTHNIDIIGFGFDFSENHLWWLINYRVQNIRIPNKKYKLTINNKIRYFYPRIENQNNINIENGINFEKIINRAASINKNKGIAEILSAFNVEVIQINCNSYNEYYDILLDSYLR